MGGIWEIENCTRVWFLAADWFVFFFKRKWMCYALKENSSFMFFFGLLPKNVPKKLSFYSFLFFFFLWGGVGGFLLAPDLIPFFIRVILHPMKNGFLTISKEKKMKMKNEFVDRRRGPFNKRKEEALEPPIRILERYLRSDRFQSRHFTSSLLKNVVIVNNLRQKKIKKKRATRGFSRSNFITENT